MPAQQSKWLIYANGYRAGQRRKPLHGSMPTEWIAGYRAAVRDAERIKKGKRGLELEREAVAR